MNEMWPIPERGGSPRDDLIPGVIERLSKPNHQPFFLIFFFFFLFLLFKKPAREACIFIFSFIIAYFYLRVGPGPRKGSGTSMYVCVWEHTHTFLARSFRDGHERCATPRVCVENVYEQRTCI